MSLRAENLSRDELIELGRLCNMPGAQGGFKNPYRNREWICANLPHFLDQPKGNKTRRQRKLQQQGHQGLHSQRGGQEPIVGQYVPMPSPLSSLNQAPLPPLMTGNFPKRKLYYCPTDPPTQALEIDEDDPRFLEMEAMFRSLPPPTTTPLVSLESTPGMIGTQGTEGTEGSESIYQTLPLSPIGTDTQPLPAAPTGAEELSPGAKATQAAIASGATGVTSDRMAGLAEEIAKRAATSTPEVTPTPTIEAPSFEGSQYGFIPGMPKPETPIPPKPKAKPRTPKRKPLPARPSTKFAKAERTTCQIGFNYDETTGMCLEVAKTCPDIEVCKAELASLGMREKDVQQLLDQVKNDLLACQSSSQGWKEIQNELQSMNLTKEETDRILVSVGKNLVARIKAGENLDSLLDRIQKTLNEGAVQVAMATEAGVPLSDVPTLIAPIVPPPLPVAGIRSRIPSTLNVTQAPLAQSTGLAGLTGLTGLAAATGATGSAGAKRPSAEQLQGVVLRKVSPVERKETQQELESTLQGALLSNPAFLARRQALQGSQSGLISTTDWE
jgi:hypothetical protein